MNSLKRPGMIVLLVGMGVSFAVSPVSAGKPAMVFTSTFKLALPVGAPEPRASGQCTIDTYLTVRDDVTVNCRKLTPGAEYVVVLEIRWGENLSWGGSTWGGWGSYTEEYFLTADDRGRINAQFTVASDLYVSRCVGDVWIEDSAGAVVLEEP